MPPVHEFKANFAPAERTAEVTDSRSTISVNSVQVYENDSFARNVCFVWPDGKRLFLNYAYLIAVECSSAQDEIKLTFSSHTIRLSGFSLDALFVGLMNHAPQFIFKTDGRYLTETNRQETIIKEIIVEENES